jgi:amino acid transporter
MPSSTQPPLRRSLGFWALVVYGVGDILGAGIYALVGKVAGMAGHASWLSFLIALVVATFTALTYAELGGRFPKSAGESWFAEQAFGSKRFALAVGWVVLCSGVLSLATMSLAFAGYLAGLLPGVPIFFVVIAMLTLLAFINFRGIRESSAANILATTIELTGLLIVVVVGVLFLAKTGAADPVQTAAPAPAPTWANIAQGGAIAFFAFIGFEDMVKVAEEVKDPERNMPRAILLALLVTGVVYLVVIVVATRVVEPSVLAQSDAPLLTVVERAEPRIPTWLFGLIALFAVANTALLNFIMGSRMLYGMARQGLLPSWLGAVHRTRRTPHWAILAVLVVALGLALSGSLTYLAGTTSLLLLLVFFTLHVSLIVIKRRDDRDQSTFRVPFAVPILGAITCVALMPFVPRGSIATGVAILALAVVLAARVESLASNPSD